MDEQLQQLADLLRVAGDKSDVLVTWEILLALCLSLLQRPGRHTLPGRGRLTLELKFRDRIPRWLRDRVALLGLRVRRFSKYAEGVLALRRR